MVEAETAPAREPERRSAVPRVLRWLPLPLAAFLTANSAVWLQRNLHAYPPFWDQANYLTMSLRFWHGLQDSGWAGLVRALHDPASVWPPLFPLTSAALYPFLGESRQVAHLANGIYLLLFLFAVQSVATRAYGTVAGVLAIVLACGFSDVIRLSRDYLFDFPAMAVLALGLWAFVRAEELRRRGGAIGFGVAVGLTALTKTMAAIFYLAPLARACARAYRAGESAAWLKGFGLASVAAAAVALPWWGPHFGTAVAYLFYYGVGSGADAYAVSDQPLFSIRNLAYYGLVLVNNAISFPSAAVIALLAGHRGWLRWRQGQPFAMSWLDGILWAWILGGYAVLTVVTNKGGDRYALFLLPPIAILYAGALCALRGTWMRRSAIALALSTGVFNYAAQTWGIARLPRLLFRDPIVFLQQDYPELVGMRSRVPLAEGTPWPVAQVAPEVASAVAAGRARRLPDDLRALAGAPSAAPEDVVRDGYRRLLRREPDDHAQAHVERLRAGTQTREGFVGELVRSQEYRDRPARVVVVPDHPVVNAATLGYFAERSRLRVRYARFDGWPAAGESLETFDAAIVKEGGWQGPPFSTRATGPLEAALRDAGSGYRPAAAWPCPDGSRVVLLVRD